MKVFAVFFVALNYPMIIFSQEINVIKNTSKELIDTLDHMIPTDKTKILEDDLKLSSSSIKKNSRKQRTRSNDYYIIKYNKKKKDITEPK